MNEFFGLNKKSIIGTALKGLLIVALFLLFEMYMDSEQLNIEFDVVTFIMRWAFFSSLVAIVEVIIRLIQWQWSESRITSNQKRLATANEKRKFTKGYLRFNNKVSYMMPVIACSGNGEYFVLKGSKIYAPIKECTQEEFVSLKAQKLGRLDTLFSEEKYDSFSLSFKADRVESDLSELFLMLRNNKLKLEKGKITYLK